MTIIQNILLTRLLRYRIASTFSPIRFEGRAKVIKRIVKYIADRI